MNVSGTKTTPGSGGDRGNSGDRGNRNPGAQPIVDVDAPPTKPLDARCVSWTSYLECIRELAPESEAAEEETTPAIPEITITDLASFAPAGAVVVGEPDNLGVVGLPTNFVTEARVHTRSGTLFGYPLSVQFTPAGYTFHYGDGESKSTGSPGASWESLAQAQFTPTDTSHTYAERGTYRARVDVSYTAAIDLGAGWFPITGRLSTTGAEQQIRIYEAHTALVAHTCAERPTAPGC